MARKSCSAQTSRTVSPSGLGKLPNELLDLIFKKLGVRELRCTRLVCSEWEVAAQPYFALVHITHSVFWLTSSSLTELERLSRKFGPYMQNVFVLTYRFGTRGLLWELCYDMFGCYWSVEWAIKLVCYESQRSQRSVLKVMSEYLATSSERREWCIHMNKATPRCFAKHYAKDIISQLWLRQSDRDVSWFTEIMASMPDCKIRMLSPSRQTVKLIGSAYPHGGPIRPAHCALYALLNSGVTETYHGEGRTHAERVVSEAEEQRKTAFVIT